ncbi:PAS domain S-box protein [Pontibacter diazotrophicus]|uniref:histidine kinase n=1 Tax=Pontibacter diazotrophicus TaxID=1400979 RepID=A0A3D8LBT7_9BACT|nr:PAS domain-containing sensor histidine kinase [Pontibacter diazotrophicus]RDV14899.1 PAS domain S-box protein [Pontibacter diazotrophicus]
MNDEALTPEFYHALVTQSAALISVVDKTGLYKYVSKSALQLVGYQPEELLGKTALEYIHNDDLHVIKTAFLLLNTKKEVEAPPFRYRTKNGNWKWLEAIFTNGMDDEHVKGYVIDARDITLKKEAQENLARGHSFYNSFLQNHPHAVFTLTPGGIFEQVNSNVCRILSYSKQEIVGEHFSKFIAPSFSFEAIKALNKAGNCESSSLEGKVVNKQGKVKTLSFTIIPICSDQQQTATLGVAKDITAEKAAQKELEKLSLIASKAVSCVLITDAAGKIEWVNSEFTRVTGYSMLESLGKKPGELLQGPETAPEAIEEMHRLFQNNEPLSVEVLNYRKNGEKFWFHMDITPIFNDESKVSQYFAIQYDITERIEAEDKMRLLSEDLIRHNRELQQFNYIVSHNLRAPVANIVGLVSLLENLDEKNESFLKVLNKLRQTSLGLDTVIKDLDEILSLRDLDKIGNQEEVCLKSVCDEVTQSLQDRIEALGGIVQVTIPEEVCLKANRAYVYSIFHNLISNSLKYRDKDRAPFISINYMTEDGQHLIKIQDNGIGIDLEKFGGRLFRLYGKLEKRTEGRGIGLYMVKAQVESLGGTIDVESTPGTGTTFYIRIATDKG